MVLQTFFWVGCGMSAWPANKSILRALVLRSPLYQINLTAAISVDID